jgi:hypothetical protein
MRQQLLRLSILITLLPALGAPQSIPAPPFPQYQLSFAQDFSLMKTLSDLNVYTTPLVGSYYLNVNNRRGTWIAHKPGHRSLKLINPAGSVSFPFDGSRACRARADDPLE